MADPRAIATPALAPIAEFDTAEISDTQASLEEWAGLDSNQGATDYESAALPLSYRPAGATLARSRAAGASVRQAVLGEAAGDRQHERVGHEAAGERVRLVDDAGNDRARSGGHAVDGLAGDVLGVEDEEARHLGLEAARAGDLGELGLGEARAQDGDRDAGAGELRVDGLRERADEGLGRRVGRHAGQRLERGGRGHVEDRALAGLDHVLHECAGELD